MKAVVAAFNQEKALVGAFSLITNLWMDLFEALLSTHDCDAPAALLQRHPGPPLLVELDLGLGQVVVLLEQQLLAGVYQPPLGGRRRVRLVRVDQVLGLAQQPLQLAVLGEQPRLLLLQRVDVVRRLLQDRGLGTGGLVSIVSYSRPL